MNIAYVSFEYPPDTAVGGISTYVYQASQLMKARNHRVEVFSASYTRTVSEEFEGILVHRIQCAEDQRFGFSALIAEVFLQRDAVVHFDVLESPEYSADGMAIKQQRPDLPLIVKLHTPHYLIRQLSTHYDSLYKRTYYLLASLLRGKKVRPYWQYLPKQEDPDYQITSLAEQIHTPSVSLGELVSKKWGIPRRNIFNVPYPYIPSPRLLSIPVNTDHRVVTFVGRLEVRKGMVVLCKAIPLVLKKCPSVKFRFSGAVSASPVPEMDMQTYILRELQAYTSSLEFLLVPSHKVPEVYAATDICVFPSIWENFPNVCLEAMSAGRGIVASREGGMKDMLESPACGLLVDPESETEIAAAILHLIDHPDRRKEMGAKAREKVLSAYNAARIGRLMDEHYQQAAVKKGIHP